LRALARGADDARDLDAEAPQRVDVHDSDESCSDDSGSHAASAAIVIEVVRASPGASIGRRSSLRSCARPSTEQLAGSIARTPYAGWIHCHTRGRSQASVTRMPARVTTARVAPRCSYTRSGPTGPTVRQSPPTASASRGSTCSE